MTIVNKIIEKRFFYEEAIKYHRGNFSYACIDGGNL